MGPRGAKRFWHGYYSGKAIDHFTAGVIPIVDSAGRQEYNVFEDHYDLGATCTRSPKTSRSSRRISPPVCVPPT
jgi:hypothetical protein